MKFKYILNTSEFVWGNNTKIVRDRFHEGLNSDCYTLLIYKDNFYRRKNQGTPRLLCEKTQYWYLKNLHTNSQQDWVVDSGVMMGDKTKAWLSISHTVTCDILKYFKNQRKWLWTSQSDSCVKCSWISLNPVKFQNESEPAFYNYLTESLLRSA